MLTERDAALLIELETLRYATAEVLDGIYYPSRKKAAERLLKMYREGFLKRDPSGIGSMAIYRLPATKQCQQIAHLMASLRLWSACKRANRLETFQPEKVITFKYKGEERIIRPDAVFSLDGKTYCYEYENVRPPKDFSRKVDGYEAWAKSGEWQETYHKFPIILVETPKMQGVREVIERVKTIEKIHWQVVEEGASILNSNRVTV
jgi:hypothetical protein